VGIKDDSSDMIQFNPEDIQDEEYQSLEYYFKYHPNRMRRKILFTKKLVFLLILLLLKMGIKGYYNTYLLDIRGLLAQ
jgi:hypothetical protein